MPSGMHKSELLEVARSSVQSALTALDRAASSRSAHRFDKDMPREIKAVADVILEDEILAKLRPTGIAVLSEEAGEIEGDVSQALRWVIDPLDGTVNFVRGLAPSAVSVALYDGERPVFGVIGEYPAGVISWGGPGLGAFSADAPLSVSGTEDPMRAVLCTGFPARFDFESDNGAFMRRAGSFGKVRMLGAASLSLLHVARGSADVYAEDDIMLWDAGAGMAIVLGAGGLVRSTPGQHRNSYNIVASNGRVPVLS